MLLVKEIISDSHQQLLRGIKTFVNVNVNSGASSIPTALVALGVNLPGIIIDMIITVFYHNY